MLFGSHLFHVLQAAAQRQWRAPAWTPSTCFSSPLELITSHGHLLPPEGGSCGFGDGGLVVLQPPNFIEVFLVLRKHFPSGPKALKRSLTPPSGSVSPLHWNCSCRSPQTQPSYFHAYPARPHEGIWHREAFLFPDTCLWLPRCPSTSDGSTASFPGFPPPPTYWCLPNQKLWTLPLSQAPDPSIQLPNGRPDCMAHRHLKLSRSEPTSFPLAFHHLVASHFPFSILPNLMLRFSWPICILLHS